MAFPIPQYSLKIAGGGMVTISTQSTAVCFATTSVPCTMVQINGASSNTSPLVVANSTAKLLATGRVGIPVYWGSTSHTVEVLCTDLQQLYADGVSTEVLSYIYYSPSVP